MNDAFAAVSRKLKRVAVNQETGRVTHVTGNLIISKGPKASIGDLCLVEPGNGASYGRGGSGYANWCCL